MRFIWQFVLVKQKPPEGGFCLCIVKGSTLCNRPGYDAHQSLGSFALVA